MVLTGKRFWTGVGLINESYMMGSRPFSLLTGWICWWICQHYTTVNCQAWVLKLGLQGRAVVPKSNSSVTCVLALLKRGKKLSSARGNVKSISTVTALAYQQFTTNSAPFVCLVCTQCLHDATVYNLQSEVAGLKAEGPTYHPCMQSHPCIMCLQGSYR